MNVTVFGDLMRNVRRNVWDARGQRRGSRPQLWIQEASADVAHLIRVSFFISRSKTTWG